MMTGLIIILVAVVTPSLCQYAIRTGVRPDVRFGEDNDRFDVTNLIRRQKKHFQPNLDSQSEEFRRSYKPKHKKKYREKENDVQWLKLMKSETGRSVLRKRIKNKLEDHVNNLANTIIHKIRDLRRNEEFSYHDNLNSEGGGTEDFKTNLRAFENNQVFKDEDVENNDRNDYIRRQNRLRDVVNKLHGANPKANQTRRVAIDPEREILFHYAFPVDMKVEGFLQAPVN